MCSFLITNQVFRPGEQADQESQSIRKHDGGCGYDKDLQGIRLDCKDGGPLPEQRSDDEIVYEINAESRYGNPGNRTVDGRPAFFRNNRLHHFPNENTLDDYKDGQVPEYGIKVHRQVLDFTENRCGIGDNDCGDEPLIFDPVRILFQVMAQNEIADIPGKVI